ncbi:MAG: alpha-1,2-fucosyltransferase [bacterium]|nr:alpha-1,2-fucosyltransferase [bacterium]
MIIVKLEGGLGNQMFQYALGRSLSLQHKTLLKFDSSYLKSTNQSGRFLEINAFQIKLEEATKEEIALYRGILPKILDKLKKESQRKYILEKSYVFDPSIAERNDGYFEGHWNSEKYFREYESVIRQDFQLKNPLSPKALEARQEITKSKNAVSIHIRRGDYVSIKKIADVHGALPVSYYETACDKIIESNSDSQFFISSDDIEWAKENFPKKYYATFLSSPEIPNAEEMVLMSNCKHHILANSTFSWWGAWLNQNPNKIVITPKQWFVDPNRVMKDLIPSSWIQI